MSDLSKFNTVEKVKELPSLLNVVAQINEVSNNIKSLSGTIGNKIFGPQIENCGRNEDDTMPDSMAIILHNVLDVLCDTRTDLESISSKLGSL